MAWGVRQFAADFLGGLPEASREDVHARHASDRAFDWPANLV